MLSLSAGRPTTTLVMCPSHITDKWAREVLLTIPRARIFLIEDLRNGGDPAKPHGVCDQAQQGKTIYEGKHVSLSEMRRLGRSEWRKRFTGPTFFITGKDKGKLSYFWDHAYITATERRDQTGLRIAQDAKQTAKPAGRFCQESRFCRRR